jgi:hypothetical protein
MDCANTLEKTINEVFENMYFMFPEHIVNPSSHFTFPIQCYVAHSNFINEKGLLSIFGTENLVNQMAMNFLGEKRAFEHFELIDVFREAANVIVGNYITSANKPPKVSFEIPVVETTTILSTEKDCLYQIDRIYEIEKQLFRIALAG